MNILDLDIETFSTVDLPKSNVYAYVEDPAFEIMMCGFSLNDAPVEVVEGEHRIIEAFQDYRSSADKIAAHNAGFERICFSRALGMPTGSYLPPEDWFDTAAVAAEYGLPRSLDGAARALGVETKDSAGARLISLFCKPYRGRRVMPAEKPEQWAEFLAYCGQDVTVLKALRKALQGWPNAFERDLWYVDQRVNDRGIKVDLPLARKAVAAAEENATKFRREMIEITGVENPGSIQQLRAWLDAQGEPLPNLQEETVSARLSDPFIDPTARRVLELRQELALVASNKYQAVLRGVSTDGRLRGQFMFHAAHTGRWSSKGVQVHNLPRLAFEKKVNGEKVYDEDAEAAAILDLMYDLGAAPETLKKLVRPLLLINGTSSDFSAIEARVLAWLAGEQWVLNAFAAGRDIYVETAERMGGLTRQQGKVAVLALGYQGAVGSLRNMGGQGTDDELLTLVKKWRRANPKIVKFWEHLERAFKTGGTVGRITVECDGSTRRVRLPSGRALTYRGVKTGQRPSYQHVRGYREDTYGGRLTENVTQAVARDLLADALVRLDAAGYPIIGHVHDEALVEDHDVEGITAIMKTGPSWADGLPLDASGDIMLRYRKG